jgi:transposase
MKTNTKFFIGIDVSKLTFDAAIWVVINHVKQDIKTEKFENSEAGLKRFFKWLRSLKVTFDENTLLVIENTGIYHRMLWAFCSENNLSIHIGNATHIKWSFGLVRGKNDRIDSIRLCKYAFKEADELKSSLALNPVLLQLKDLQTSRVRLISQRNANKTYLKELKNISNKQTQKVLEQGYKSAINGIEKSIIAFENEIKKIISTDKDMKETYKLLISVPGIGHITAIYMIICTNNFAGNLTGKQLACYAGVAPFGNTSGTSIKGKEKVHKMANKELKTLLFLCAMSAANHNPEIRDYYERKIKEGKHFLSVINAIKNKLILRAVAVVRNKKPFVSNYIILVDNLKKAS